MGDGAAGGAVTRAGHRADVQALRGLAVLLVVAYHVGIPPLQGGFVGVDVFFVISGFVIARSLAAELAGTGRVDLRRFYVRRVRRLLPALALLLVAVCTFSVVVESPFGQQQTTAQTTVAASVFAANHELAASDGDYFAEATEANPLLHTWSLAVEEQFYAAFPIVLLVLWRLLHRRAGGTAMWVTLAAVGLASLALSERLVASGDDSSFGFYGMAPRAWEFLAGVLLVPVERRLAYRTGHAGPACTAAGLGLIALSAIAYSEKTPFPGGRAVLPVLGAALVITGGSMRRAAAGALCGRPLQRLGDLSYSWYLWHWPAIAMTAAFWPSTAARAGAAALSLGPAALSQRVVEEPIRTGRRLVDVSPLLLGAACATLPMLAAVGLRAGADAGWGLDPLPSQSGRLAREACTDTAGGFPEADCTWRVPGARGLILVLGDSHATSLSDGAVRAGNALGYDVGVWAFSRCPFLGSPPAGYPLCAKLQAATLSLALQRADAVVVANRSPWYTMAPAVPVGVDRRPERIRLPDGRAPRNPQEALEGWRAGLVAVRDRLVAADIPLLWVSTVPEHAKNLRHPVSLLRPDPVGRELTRSAVEVRRRAVAAVEAEVLGGHASISIVDPAHVLCAPRCATVVRGEVRYVDGHHLAPAGSLALADLLRQELESLLGMRPHSRRLFRPG